MRPAALFASRGRPISGCSDAKKRLDRLAPDLAEWRYHDLRRTARSGLARLRVPPHVSELVLSTARPD
jgi:hypothetical protein